MGNLLPSSYSYSYEDQQSADGTCWRQATFVFEHHCSKLSGRSHSIFRGGQCFRAYDYT